MLRGSSRKLVLFLCLIAAFFFAGCGTIRSSAPPAEFVSDGFEYDGLEGYGAWTAHDRFGHIWRPNVDFGWRPFYYGHWLWSVEGWLWVSYEPFGWITHHHGHWYYDPYLRWVWVPGYRWSPAVVIWMQFGDYLGWAPMPPPGIVIGDPWDDPRTHYWNFVDNRHFQKEYIGKYIHREPLQKPLPRTSVIRKQPDLRVIEKVTNLRIVAVPIGTKRMEVEKKIYERTLLPRAEAEKVKKHSPEVMKNVLKAPPPVKKAPVKKPPSKRNE